MNRASLSTLAAAAGALLIVMVRAGEVETGSASHGREIYDKSGCVRCHAASIAEDRSEGGPVRAGHPLEGAAYRGTWWNGRITTDAAEASDFCRRTFLDPNNDEGFTTPERKALVLFMQELGSDYGISPLTLLRRDAGDVDLRDGNAGRGKDLYRRACLACHAAEDSDRADAELRKMAEALSPAQIAQVIRVGKGTMPFFQVDRLTATQVADIATYMESVKEAAASRR
ncbi:MAG TPA: c-type cytochrome [Candidatus Polarisedimenticolia bacterium]|jgi:mono/diheme cytochrome c family protein